MKLRSHQHGIGEVFFCSDHHFGHRSVIDMCGRPFANVDEMDRSMIDQWNAVVGPRDVVWHLGDLAHRIEPDRLRKIFNSLNGQKHLVIGNHDRQHTLDLPWISVQQMAHITVDEQRLHLCHYSLRVWPGQHRGALHLYGHSHGRLPGNSTTMDVGVDAVGYMPLRLEHIREKLAKLPAAPIPDDIEADDTTELTV